MKTYSKGIQSLLKNEITSNVEIYQLYNKNRTIGFQDGKFFLDMCLKKGFLTIKTYEAKQTKKWIGLSPDVSRFESIIAKQHAISEVREYSQENEKLLEIVANMLSQLRKMNQNVEVFHELTNGWRYDSARIYLPKFKLFISPITQTFHGLLFSLIQKEHGVWIVSKETYGDTAFIHTVERTERFYEAYERFKEVMKHERMEVYGVQKLSRIYKQ